MRTEFKKRRDYIVRRLNNINGINCAIPGGAFYVFPNFSNYMGSDRKISCSNDLSMYLLEKKSVVTVSGEAFGGDDHIRFSYAASEDDLQQAMNLLEETLNEI